MSLRNIQGIQVPQCKVNAWQDITDTLPRKTTGDWEPDRKVEDVKFLSIHHSAVENGSITGYANTHVNKNGWRSIGYHIVIKGNQTYQVNDLLSFTYHTSGHNDTTIGISISADLSKRDITEDERNNLYVAILTCMELFNIPVENVLGHREYTYNKTECPVISMSKVRDDIRTIKHQMDMQNSWEAKMTKISAMINQFNYFNSLLKAGKEDGNAQWSANQQMLLYDAMKARGYV